MKQQLTPRPDDFPDYYNYVQGTGDHTEAQLREWGVFYQKDRIPWIWSGLAVLLLAIYFPYRIYSSIKHRKARASTS